MDYAIIAAGEGSRLAQEGIKRPKPLVRLNGTALIDRLIHIFLKNDASSIRIIVNEEMTEVQEHLKGLELRIPFHLLVKSTSGSMHSFYELSRRLESDRLCLATVDAVFREEEFAQYIRAFKSDPGIDGLMAVTDYIDDERPLHVQTGEDMLITAFLDQTETPRYVSGGIYCLRQSAIRVLSRCMEQGMSRMRSYQRQLIAEGLRLKAYPFSKIIDVDHAGDIRKAERFTASKRTILKQR